MQALDLMSACDDERGQRDCLTLEHPAAVQQNRQLLVFPAHDGWQMCMYIMLSGARVYINAVAMEKGKMGVMESREIWSQFCTY
jgi:hypothetical protein